MPIARPLVSGRIPVLRERTIEDWQVAVSPTEIRGGYSVAALAALAKKRGYSISPKDRKTLSAFVDVSNAPRRFK